MIEKEVEDMTEAVKGKKVNHLKEVIILYNIERQKWSDTTSASRFSVAPSDYDKSQNYPTKPTAVYGSNSSVNPNILYTLNDNTKIKRKIFIPKVSGVNFVGLLIGPRGTYQKRLEQQSGCKILIRGKYV